MAGQLEALIHELASKEQIAVNLDPAASRSLELAESAAAQLKHRFVGTGHLLLGVMREGSSAPVFEFANLNPNEVTGKLAATEELRAPADSPSLAVSLNLQKSLDWATYRCKKMGPLITNTRLLETAIYLNDSRARHLIGSSLPDQNDIIRIANVVNSPMGSQVLDGLRTFRQALHQASNSKADTVSLIRLFQLEAERAALAMEGHRSGRPS